MRDIYHICYTYQGMQKTKSIIKQNSQSTVFVSMALDMSWRLAIVVLVPIIGGFKLDEVLHLTPLLTITGFVLAMGGMALVLWRMLREASEITIPKPKITNPKSGTRKQEKSA